MYSYSYIFRQVFEFLRESNKTKIVWMYNEGDHDFYWESMFPFRKFFEGAR